MKSSLLRCAPLAAVAALGFASTAQAASSPAYLSSTGKGPKGYALSVGGSPGYASVDLSKSKSGSNQSHDLSRSGKGVAYKVGKNLSSAKLKASYGSLGAVNMKFVPTGPLAKGPKLPKGCTGKRGVQRKGILRGTLKFRMKKGGASYSKKSLAATLSKGSTITRCSGTPGGGFTHSYNLNPTLSGNALSVFASRYSGKRVTQNFSVYSSPTKVISLSHTIYATKKGAKYFDPKTDLSSAKMVAIGPWLSGSLSYTADPSQSSGGTSSYGTMTGKLKAKFDFIGTKSISPTEGALNYY